MVVLSAILIITFFDNRNIICAVLYIDGMVFNEFKLMNYIKYFSTAVNTGHNYR